MANKKYFLAATKEVEKGNLDEALWAKQLAVAKGDEEKAKYEYIAERATTLQKDAITRFFNPILKKYIPRFLILAGSLFVIFMLINNTNQKRLEQQRIEKIKIEAEEEKAEIERNVLLIEEVLLAYRNSRTGLECVIKTGSSGGSYARDLYDPFYLIVNIYKDAGSWNLSHRNRAPIFDWDAMRGNPSKDMNIWGDSLDYVVWSNYKRLKYAFPSITGNKVVDDYQKKHLTFTPDREWNEDAAQKKLIPVKGQEKLSRSETYWSIKNLTIDSDTLKFYVTHKASEETEVTGSCTKISYDKVLEIVDQAQRRADPDGLYRD